MNTQDNTDPVAHLPPETRQAVTHLRAFLLKELENGEPVAVLDALTAIVKQARAAKMTPGTGAACGRLAYEASQVSVQQGSQEVAAGHPGLVRLEWSMDSEVSAGKREEYVAQIVCTLQIPDGGKWTCSSDGDKFSLDGAPDMLLMALVGGAATDLSRAELQWAAEAFLPDFAGLSMFCYDVMNTHGGATTWDFALHAPGA